MRKNTPFYIYMFRSFHTCKKSITFKDKKTSSSDKLSLEMDTWKTTDAHATNLIKTLEFFKRNFPTPIHSFNYTTEGRIRNISTACSYTITIKLLFIDTAINTSRMITNYVVKQSFIGNYDSVISFFFCYLSNTPCENIPCKNTHVKYLMQKQPMQQECIPVGCVLPNLYHWGSPWQRHLWTETPQTDTPFWAETHQTEPPGQRPPWTEKPLDRHPWTETPWTETPRQSPLDGDPPDRDVLDRDPSRLKPWTEIPLDRDSPGQRLPWTETPLDRDPLGQRPPGIDPQTDTPLDRDPQTEPPGWRPPR